MKVLRALAFLAGIVLIVLGAVSVIDFKTGLVAGVVLMGGSVSPLLLKLLGIGGG